MVITKPLTKTVEEFVSQHFRDKIAKEYVYHDFAHTLDVVRVCRQIGNIYSLTNEEFEILEIAAWFHDTGYDKGAENHELRSSENAARFLDLHDFSQESIEAVINCIKATKMPQSPKNLIEQIICDADLSHLGEKSYWLRTARLRQEFAAAHNRVMNEEEWLDFELGFLTAHQYHTEVAKELFDKRKLKHILQLRKQKMRLNPDLIENFDFENEKTNGANAGLSKQDLKFYDLGRGVETMYRTTYNTHNNLSALADHKANLMLSINTIMISITLSGLVPRLHESPALIAPTIILLLVCLTSIVFATLSTRPKVTKGMVTLEDIQQRRSNLLFFGNFFNMKLEDFQWGMTEMIRDPEFQYNSMTRDLYFLGKVLNQKYRYLTICYNVFMFGLIGAVILFAIAFATSGNVQILNSIKLK